MRVHEFPGCCSAHIIGDLGGTGTSYGRSDVRTVKELFNELYAKSVWIKRNGIISATTNSDQKEANRFLRKMGFRSSKPSASGTHGKSIRIWWIDAAILQQNIKKEMSNVNN